jgi:DNA-binding transcriptional MerR regulator
MSSAGTIALLGIGEMAERTGASERALRYYEEIGLLRPEAYSTGGFRRYSEAQVARVGRIRELQQLMGFDLDEIRVVLAAEDRLEELRAAWHHDAEPGSRRGILEEALAIVSNLLGEVGEKRARLGEFQGQLEAKVTRYRELLDGWAEEEDREPGRPKRGRSR